MEKIKKLSRLPLNSVEKSLFAFPKFVQQQFFAGKVGTFVFFRCQLSTGCCISKVINVG